jgi:hypothetical protein
MDCGQMSILFPAAGRKRSNEKKQGNPVKTQPKSDACGENI